MAAWLSLWALALTAQVPTVEPAAPPTAGFAVEVYSAGTNAVSCPSAPQLSTALNARMPGIVPAAGAPLKETILRLALSQSGDNALRMQLTDRSGTMVLERVLELLPRELPPRDGAPHGDAKRPHDDHDGWSNCAALADTVALIVERYLRHIGYRGDIAAPEPKDPMQLPATALTGASVTTPAPARTAEFLLGASADLSAPVRGLGGNSQWTTYAGATAAVHSRRFALSLSAAVGTPTETPPIPLTAGGVFRLTPLPLRTDLALRIPLPWGVLLPAVGLGADLLFASSQNIPEGGRGVTTEPVVEVGGGLLVGRRSRLYAKVHAYYVVNLRPHDFEVNGLPFPVFSTARLYFRAGIDLGFRLGAGGPNP